ncbi:MAG: hypothetical protein RBT75_09350 [Anaerolineae bacterium]|jgi:hypothetical protein|nr:hypothetical protein [Anaerolineae bacterium]
MISIFDLRTDPDPETVVAIAALYGEQPRYKALGPAAIRACIGCWTCWWKTPGKCVHKDALAESCADYVNADKVILLMDTAQGFINHSAKALIDRTIPHYHPYIEIVDGECHHKARYERYPELHFYYDNQNVTPEEAQVIEDYLYRTAYHFRSKAYRLHKHPAWTLTELRPRSPKNKALKPNASGGFIVQQGFPESSQSYFLEAYFERLTQRLQRDYIGTAIKGGIEGFQLQPAKGQEKILAPFVELVGSVLESGQMAAPILAQLADPDYLSKKMLFLFRLLAPTGLTNLYWDKQLKQNNAFKQRFDRPY